jgi:pimeloyl-ACP methyl ester carboxylesterase
MTSDLALVPGLGLDAAAWEPTTRCLAGARCEVTLLPGYGERAGAGADLRPATLAETLLTRLPEGRFVLAGHSASCQVVAHAARLAPDRVTGLFLVGPTTDPRAQGWPRLVRRWLATARHERPGQVPSLVRQYHRTTLAVMARAMDSARKDRIDETLAQVRCPVRVVRGRHDRICPPDWAQALGATDTLAAGGHMVPLTHGDLVAPLAHRLVGSVG